MVGNEFDLLGLIRESGQVVKGVLLILFLFSVISWAIIGRKLSDLKRIRQESSRFLRLFRSGAEASEVYKNSRVLNLSPLCGVFRSGYELIYGAEARKGVWSGDREDLRRALDAAAAEQMAGLERHLIFLATVGNVSPFIGLFGTVWGIMSSFQNIGARGSASLAVVAPGIAEALIATAMGLAAAVPAVIAYNYFLGRIEAIQREADQFAVEMAATVPGGLRS
ncbi:MAG: protein TolQ [Candidatus Latescibacteria bacterium]|nr:protein TolQ [Candidatus Latescibacterota bacterium]